MPLTALYLLIALAAALLSGMVVYLLMQRRCNAVKEAHTAVTLTLEMERRATQDKIAAMQKGHEELTQTFTALSSRALRENNEEFLKLAQEKLQQFQIKAQGELEQKEKSIESLVTPIKQALEKTEQQIRQIELERKQTYGSLSQHLEAMAQSQQLLQGETRNLVQALRRPEVRGQWGELTLKRVAELSGMVEYCDFFQQEHISNVDGAFRPDMIIRMPDGCEIVVDVKTPLDAYLSALEAPDDETRKRHLTHHARKVGERVKELASKEYWNQLKNTPEYVILFIPGDQFLSAALDVDQGLLEAALRQKVVLTTPTSFVTVLRTISYCWRQQTIALNAEKIRDVGTDLYKRLSTFSEHLSKLGKSLNSSTDHFNNAVGSFERSVIPGARKFTEMGIQGTKSMEPLEPLNKGVRIPVISDPAPEDNTDNKPH